MAEKKDACSAGGRTGEHPTFQTLIQHSVGLKLARVDAKHARHAMKKAQKRAKIYGNS